MYYLRSESKGADQLHSYHKADLHLCFRTCKTRFSHDMSHNKSRITRKPVFRVSDQVQHKPGCTTIENS